MIVEFGSKALRLALWSALFFVALTRPSLPDGQPSAMTTIYMIRHAEKADAIADPPLSDAGKSRAEELAHVLRDAGIDAVFVTKFLRSRQTGEPIAKRLHLEPIGYDDAEALAQRILGEHVGGRILVVVHSNTVRDIARSLGVEDVPELTESAFDRLFVVHRVGSFASVDRLRYGAPTP